VKITDLSVKDRRRLKRLSGLDQIFARITAGAPEEAYGFDEIEERRAHRGLPGAFASSWQSPYADAASKCLLRMEALYSCRIDGLHADLTRLLASEVTDVQPVIADDIDMWEGKLEHEVATDTSIPETTRETIVQARRGQGLFRDRVTAIEKRCRVTGVENPVHLIASHCKPWRDADNEERLDGENGLLLTPSIDHLFDRGFIGFEDGGRLIVSPVAHGPSLLPMGVDAGQPINVGGFTSGQKRFLDFHRNSDLLQANRRWAVPSQLQII
jgi:hypothetical protein